jgi:hypothetical protein
LTHSVVAEDSSSFKEHGTYKKTYQYYAGLFLNPFYLGVIKRVGRWWFRHYWTSESDIFGGSTDSIWEVREFPSAICLFTASYSTMETSERREEIGTVTDVKVNEKEIAVTDRRTGVYSIPLPEFKWVPDPIYL